MRRHNAHLSSVTCVVIAISGVAGRQWPGAGWSNWDGAVDDRGGCEGGLPDGKRLGLVVVGGGLSGGTLTTLIVTAGFGPVTLIVVISCAGNAQRGEEGVHELRTGDAAVPAPSAKENDVNAS